MTRDLPGVVLVPRLEPLPLEELRRLMNLQHDLITISPPCVPFASRRESTTALAGLLSLPTA